MLSERTYSRNQQANFKLKRLRVPERGRLKFKFCIKFDFGVR